MPDPTAKWCGGTGQARRLAFALPIDTNPELDELLAHLSALMT